MTATVSPLLNDCGFLGRLISCGNPMSSQRTTVGILTRGDEEFTTTEDNGPGVITRNLVAERIEQCRFNGPDFQVFDSMNASPTNGIKKLFRILVGVDGHLLGPFRSLVNAFRTGVANVDPTKKLTREVFDEERRVLGVAQP